MNGLQNLVLRLSAAMLGAMVLFFSANSFAQEDGYKQPSIRGATTDAAEEDALAKEEPTEFMNWFTFAPELGYAYFRKANIDVAGYELEMQERNALVGKLNFAFGGDGVAVELIPFVAIERSGGGFTAAAVDLSSGVGGGLGGEYTTIGAQGHLVYRWSIGPFYPHIGLGGLAGFMFGPDVDWGVELYLRVPVGFTIYMMKSLAFVVEGAFMWGATGVKYNFNMDDIYAELNIDPTQIDPNNPPDPLAEAQAAAMEEVQDKMRFGMGIAFDVSIGLRFP